MTATIADLLQTAPGARAVSAFAEIARSVPTFWVPAHPSPPAPAGEVHGAAERFDGTRLAVAWTRAPAETILLRSQAPLEPRPAEAYLREVLRADCDGLMLNPGEQGSLWLTRSHIRELLRHYAVPTLGSAVLWAVEDSDGLLVSEVMPGHIVIPVYSSRAAAAEAFEGEAVVCQVSWDRLWDALLENAAACVLLDPDRADFVPVHRHDIARLCGDGRRSALDLLEEAIARAGSGEPGELVAALAALDHIWALVDRDGDIVTPSGSGAVLLFSSPLAATFGLQVISRTVEEVGSVAGVHPAAMRTRDLWERLVEERLDHRLVLNAGSLAHWEGPVSVLQHVLLLSRTAAVH